MLFKIEIEYFKKLLNYNQIFRCKSNIHVAYILNENFRNWDQMDDLNLSRRPDDTSSWRVQTPLDGDSLWRIQMSFVSVQDFLSEIFPTIDRSLMSIKSRSAYVVNEMLELIAGQSMAGLCGLLQSLSGFWRLYPCGLSSGEPVLSKSDKMG